MKEVQSSVFKVDSYRFKQLKVWQKSIELVEYTYREVLPRYPTSEKFGLVSQISRAAISIPLNIAEGAGRYSKKEFKQFLYNARGSLYELITQCEISFRLNLINEDIYNNINKRIIEISGLLNGLINSLK